MDHRKRKRTRELMRVLWCRHFSATRWPAVSFSVYPHDEVLGYVIDELKTFTVEDYERIEHESD